MSDGVAGLVFVAQDFCAEVGCKLVYGLSAMYGACCVRYDDERTMYGTGHCEGCGVPEPSTAHKFRYWLRISELRISELMAS